jgi:hypothetical protein
MMLNIIKNATFSKNIAVLFLALAFVACDKIVDDPDDNGNDTIDIVDGRCPRLTRVIQQELSTDALLDLVQQQTLRYFWEFAETNSGMARERNTSGNLVTTGGTGFGIMAMIAGAERGFISRHDVLLRVLKISNFLKRADRFQGAWSHWIDGTTGRVIPFSQRDNGGDLVETAFLVQGLIAAREYFNGNNALEDSLRALVDTLWHGVNWQWFTRNQNVLYWHWSPNYNWDMNMQISGWNEAMIVYVLAAASPTYPIAPAVYHQGWARNGAMRNGRTFYDVRLPLGVDFGGPLFFAHYSFLGLDPRGLKDQYADYWQQNRHHSLINQRYSIYNPKNFCHYSDSLWGLTASDDPEVGYQAHAPFGFHGVDNGTITPTAALSSMPYTPEESMKALRTFYYYLGDKIWGSYGFRDAFNLDRNWFAQSYLAIDQGPIIVMIENHRTGLLWDVFMKNQDVAVGLERLGFSYD